MNSSRQLLLGAGVFLGGGVLLFAMMQQAETTPTDAASTNSTDIMATSQQTDSNNMLEPLTADIKTEERILAEKKRARELKVAELDRRAKAFLEKQEQAESLANKKARLENEKYRDNAIEPTNDITADDIDAEAKNSSIAKPTVTQRNPEQNTSAQTSQTTPTSQQAQSKPVVQPPVTAQSQPVPQPQTKSQPQPKPPTKPINYTVKRGDGFIKIAKRHNVPLEALLQANKLSADSTIHTGRTLTIPAGNQIKRLVREYNTSQATQNKTNPAKPNEVAKESTQNKAPTQATKYEVKRGDGFIKLARRYNVPVEALAEANNMSTNSSLQAGQTITIPSRKQVARLQREAKQRQQSIAAERDAQQRLAEARRKAKQGEAKGTFGVQVVLADDQARADKMVKKLRAAGYPASTSRTSRGVRVIVGPEKGKEAALALKDKINADTEVDVNNAWVLYWR